MCDANRERLNLILRLVSRSGVPGNTLRNTSVRLKQFNEKKYAAEAFREVRELLVFIVALVKPKKIIVPRDSWYSMLNDNEVPLFCQNGTLKTTTRIAMLNDWFYKKMPFQLSV